MKKGVARQWNNTASNDLDRGDRGQIAHCTISVPVILQNIFSARCNGTIPCRMGVADLLLTGIPREDAKNMERLELLQKQEKDDINICFLVSSTVVYLFHRLIIF